MNFSTSNFENLENLKIEYDSHFGYMTKGAIIPSKSNWYEQHEKSNNFLVLDKSRYHHEEVVAMRSFHFTCKP